MDRRRLRHRDPRQESGRAAQVTFETPAKKTTFDVSPPPQVDRVGVRLRLGGGEECERAQEEEDHVRPPRRQGQPQEQGSGWIKNWIRH